MLSSLKNFEACIEFCEDKPKPISLKDYDSVTTTDNYRRLDYTDNMNQQVQDNSQEIINNLN